MASLKEAEITMRSQIEIQKRFFAKEVPDHFAELPHIKITQGDLTFDEPDVELRLCKLCEARLLPLKIQQRDIRLEREIKLIQELRPAPKRRCLRNLRNWMPHDGVTVQTSRFSQARLARDDVSDVEEYSNHFLALRGSLRAPRAAVVQLSGSLGTTHSTLLSSTSGAIPNPPSTDPPVERLQETCSVDETVCGCGRSYLRTRRVFL